MFATTFEAQEAPYLCRETVLQYPGYRQMNKKAALVSEEFIAEENVNYEKSMSVNEGVNEGKDTVITDNFCFLLNKRVLPRPHDKGHSPLTPHLLWSRERKPSLLQPASRLS
jgi:hypothetical protein